jgi:predicted XRE-type DNA-binding protein
MSDELTYEVGSGNVFADLGLPDAEELKAKSDLVIEIVRIIQDRGLKQAEAAEIMGIDQPKVSALMNGKLDGFSMERLYRLLNALGRDVEIVVKPKPKSRKVAQLTVTRKAARTRVRRPAKV